MKERFIETASLNQKKACGRGMQIQGFFKILIQ